MKNEKLKKILSSVQTPGRYTGREYNRYRPKPGSKKFLLCYPDDYKIGMSSLGYHTVGKIVSLSENFSVQRCFAPAPDMEKVMRNNKIELFSLETKTPASRFDMIGFSVHHELTFTNLVNMLDLAGLQPERVKRSSLDPVVIAGGPATVNPSILGEFVDLLVVGEAEAVLPQLLEAYAGSSSKEGFLSSAARMEGVFVPSAGGRVKIKPFKEFSDRYVPYDHPVPGINIPHDRINVEISRGCRGSCRFCQASVIYAPYREKPSFNVLRNASKSVACSGFDEIALTSLSATDHSDIIDIMDDLHYAFRDLGVSTVMPSLRPEDFGGRFAGRLSRLRRGGLTFAPETPSQRLKKIINKNIANEQIIMAARQAALRGWRKMKLYFMIGLPSETMEDIDEIGEFIGQIKSETGMKNITVSLSAFTPQPHTPLQWADPDTPANLIEKEKRIKKSFRGTVKGVNVQTHIISSLLSRGGSGLGEVVIEAFREGARFDQWGEHFNFGAWKRAFQKKEKNMMDFYFKKLVPEDTLSWDRVQTRAGRDYLLKAYRHVMRLIEENKSG